MQFALPNYDNLKSNNVQRKKTEKIYIQHEKRHNCVQVHRYMLFCVLTVKTYIFLH